MSNNDKLNVKKDNDIYNNNLQIQTILMDKSNKYNLSYYLGSHNVEPIFNYDIFSGERRNLKNQPVDFKNNVIKSKL